MKKGRIFWGMLFIVGAIFLIVNSLGLLGGQINFWTLLLTILLFSWLIKSGKQKDITGVLFSIAFLAIIYAEPLGITAITPWTVLGAAFLGSIGFSILFSPKKKYMNHHHKEHFDSTETVEGERIELDTNFSSSIRYINSDDFKEASLSCTFGAMKIYFDHVTIQGTEAVIRISSSFAGIELFIPKEWNVINDVNCSLGGIEEKNYNSSTGGPTVHLVGNINFSGITIVYV